MIVLVLNCGSSSLKFQVIDTSLEAIQRGSDVRMARGIVERIGLGEGVLRLELPRREPRREAMSARDHREAIDGVLRLLVNESDGVLHSRADIRVVGHRVVHGGEHFARSSIITPEVVRAIEECIDLAPLHNPANLRGYRMAASLLPDVPHVAVFDTSFHQTMPHRAFLYGLPWDQYARNKVRRYGFHGTSHRFICYRLARLLGIGRREVNAVSCHLGNGSSVCAIRSGESIDTTMGFTPLEGLPMGTRCGDLDPGILFYMMGREDLHAHEIATILNKQSGLLGVSGVSSDMREILAAEKSGNERAHHAVDLYCYRATKAIAAMAPFVGKPMHGIIFTGGIGENSAEIRRRIVEPLAAYGVTLDPLANESESPDVISGPGSLFPVRVVPTDEELVIARDSVRAVEKATGSPA